ncbi:hypothetical protein M5362_31375 [Streptomyces sp. Je 1-79]|uniref:hypothetical protein n=1 Tax=Streptomyces sp. Je 1-79 TaxID=2943847 RepID=UPI0021A508C9|nr:hypothetical protein [Streptomyces sp. Je 1-79]MCT4357609.1 hypothetical protein [Streptomyces sp. Je 1-79]
MHTYDHLSPHGRAALHRGVSAVVLGPLVTMGPGGERRLARCIARRRIALVLGVLGD